MEKMHDFQFDQLEDGTVTLAQQSGVEEPNVIWLHPEQVLFIARRLCGMRPGQAELAADLERKISILASRLNDLVDDDWFRKSVVEGPEGIEALVRLDAITDLATEFTTGLKCSQAIGDLSAPKPDGPPAGQLDLPV
jgi:hypothetical protein